MNGETMGMNGKSMGMNRETTQKKSPIFSTKLPRGTSQWLIYNVSIPFSMKQYNPSIMYRVVFFNFSMATIATSYYTKCGIV